MKIEFVRSGGFAGIRLARTVDTNDLPPDQAKKLESLVQGAEFFELPDIPQPSSVIPDSIMYHITVTAATQTRVFAVTDNTMPAQLRPLLDYLTSLAKLGPTP